MLKNLLYTFFWIFLFLPSAQAQVSNRFVSAYQHYQNGKDLYNKNQFGPSIIAFQKFTEMAPNAPQNYDAQIYILLSKLKLQHKNTSRQLTRLALQNTGMPVNNFALFELGNHYFSKSKYRQAKKYYSKVDASEYDYENYEKIQFNLGYSYFKINEMDVAKRRFERIKNKTTSPYYLRTNYFYGYICYAQKQFEEAIENWSKLGDKGPKTMQLQLAQIYYGKGDYKQAIEKAKLANINKLNQASDLLLGKCYFQQANYENAYIYLKNIDSDKLTNEEKAQIAYCEYLYEHPEKATALLSEISSSEGSLGQMANYYLAKTYLKNSDKKNAFSALAISKNIEEDKNIQELSLFNYAKLCFELNRHTEAFSALELFQKKYPKSQYQGETNQIMAFIFLKNKDYIKAINYIEKMPILSKSIKEVYQKTTLKYAKQKILNADFEDGIKFLNKSKKYPVSKAILAETNFWLGESYFQSQKFQKSKHFTEAYLINKKLAPNLQYKANYNLGYANYQMKKIKLAASNFSKCAKQMEKAHKKNKMYVDALTRSADCYFLIGNYNGASWQYRKIIKNNFFNKDYALFQSGIIYGLLNQYNKKISSLKEIITSFKKSSYMDDAIFELASTYQEKNNTEDAVKLYELLVSKYNFSPYLADAQLRIGLIYYNKGRNQQAIDNYKKVVENFPNTAYAKQAMNFVKLIYTDMGQGDLYIDFVNSTGGEMSMSLQDSLLYETAWKKYQNGDCDKASIGFDKYLKQFKKNGFFKIQAAYYLAECSFYGQNIPRATNYYRFVANSTRNEFSEKAAKKAAKILSKDSTYDLAYTYYQKFEQYASNTSNKIIALMGQIRCLDHLNQKEEMKSLAFKALSFEEINTTDKTELNMKLAHYFWDKEVKDSAVVFYSNVVALSRSEFAAEAQYKIASYHFSKGDLKACADAIYFLNDQLGNYTFWLAKAFVLLGDIYMKDEDYFQARATYQSILDGYDGNQEILDEVKHKIYLLNQLEMNKVEENIIDDSEAGSIGG